MYNVHIVSSYKSTGTMHIFQKAIFLKVWTLNRTESKSDVRKCTLRIKYENIYSIHSTKNTDNDTNLASKLIV